MNNDEFRGEFDEINLNDVIFALKKKKKTVIAILVLGFVLGCIVSTIQYISSNIEKTYNITASFAIIPKTEDGVYASKYTDPNNQDIYLAEDMAQSVIYVCGSDRVLNSIINKLYLIGVSARDIKKQLSFSQYEDTQIVEVSLRWPNEKEGISILTAMSEVAPDILIETLKIGNMSMVNEPTVVAETSVANVWIIIIFIFIAFVFAVAYSYLPMLIHPTIVRISDVERLFDLDNIAEIPIDYAYRNFQRKGLPVEENKLSVAFKEGYSSAAYILLNFIGDKKESAFKLMVTSTLQDEGKTCTVANLGVNLAKIGKKVLMIDCDIYHPSLGGAFYKRIDKKKSMNAIYKGETTIEEAIINVDKNLDLLPTRIERKKIVVEEFASKLISEMEKKYDIILIDTPPIGLVSDALKFSSLSDYAIYVIGYDTVWCKIIKDNVDKLQDAGVSIVASIVNKIDPRTYSSVYYYQNYKSMYNVNSEDNKYDEREREKTLFLDRVFRRKKKRQEMAEKQIEKEAAANNDEE